MDIFSPLALRKNFNFIKSLSLAVVKLF